MRAVRFGILGAGVTLSISLLAGAPAMADDTAPTPTPTSGAVTDGAVPGVVSDADDVKGYKDEAGNVIAPADDSGSMTTAQISCTPETGVDNPHVSKTKVDVSGHGWWQKGTCTAATAHVTSCLYEWYTDGYFYQKDCNSRKVKPGTGKRANSRIACHTNVMTTWTNRVDVDVDGRTDPSDYHSKKANVACRTF
ncbi:hypothetical protein [Kineosporia sp. NBRC 101731]|uniref:hypothetical protein n=1 Tax=Kineosporia sp. NBRC 101731 TaxID=3032199 RepID=UPI0024A0AE61|nr:hypothetical protein [Kineosporia sp. NBRC 101731]GLY29104.1 hypothetical protein Kisp02_24690 [Kineosporia sp. NBRC 101731]